MRLLRLITDHWELKLVAIVVAIALYTYTAGQVRVERTVPVSLTEAAVKGLPPEFQVTSIEPREFKVLLNIPSSRLVDLTDGGLSPRLDIEPEQLAAGVATFPLTSRVLRLSDDVRVVATEPAELKELTVRFDRIGESELSVDEPRLVGLPAGLDAEVSIEPTMAHLRAPASVLERLAQERHRVRFHEIPLDHLDPGLTGERIEVVPLIPLPPPAESPYSVVTKVTARVVIRPLPGLAKQVELPVQVLSDPSLLRSVRIAVDPPLITVELRGPENLLRELPGEEGLRAFVPVKPSLAMDERHPLTVIIQAPPGITVSGGSQTVAVVLTRP